MTLKATIFWVVGALLILAGSWIIGNLEHTIGVGYSTYATMIVVSFILFLFGGLCWIYVSKRELK